MRVFIKNKAHPSLVLVDRSITKEQFKAAWGTCRAGYLKGFIGSDLYYVCDWVSKDRNQPDPLIVKSASLAMRIEYSQVGVAA